MNPLALFPAAAAGINILLVLVVLVLGVKSVANRLFLVWGGTIVIWNIATYFMFVVPDKESAMFWARWIHFGVIPLPAGMLHLCCDIAKFKNPLLIRGAWILTMVFLCLNATGQFVVDVRRADFAWYSQAGPALWYFLVMFSACGIGALGVLATALRGSRTLRRARLYSLFGANAMLMFFGTNDLLPILGFYNYPGTTIPVYPLGSIAAAVYGILVFYAVLHFDLLSLRTSLSQRAAQLVRLLFLAAVWSTLLMLALWLFPRAFNQQSVAISGGIFLFTLLLAAYAFPRVIGEASSQLQRLVGGDRFAKLDKLRLFSEQLRRHIDVRSMAEELEPILIAAFSLRGFHLVCADDSGRGFTAAYAYPADREIVVSDLNQKSAVFECFRLTGLKWLTSTDETTDGPQLPAVDEARAKLRMWGGQLLVPFTADNAMLGFLMLQRERHEQPFTGPEMDQLLQLCGEIGLMLHQIGMKNEILLNRELDLLGRMSRGMAHDLNNLTVPISTLLQLVNEGADQGILRTDLLPVAMRNLQTMRNYIKEALFFSENLRPQIARTNLGNTVRGLAEVVQASTRSRKQIVVETNNPGDVMADIDEVLIQRLLTNLITNAIDASPEGATVKVELTETVFNKRGDVKEGSSWAYIRVIDRGHGIHREHLNRIFTPYFTTKNSGDEERGFGLGLAICRKIAKLHHGSLSVQSELGKGTVITLELPCSQESVITDFRKTA